MTNKNSIFDDLLVQDLLALVLIYADVVSMINLDEFTPSSTLKLEYKGKASAQWNMWLAKSQLTGIDVVDNLVKKLAKAGLKNHDELASEIMDVFTRDLGSKDPWFSDRRENS